MRIMVTVCVGMHHFRNVAPKGTTTLDGTKVNVREIKELVEQAVEAVQKQPTCLHDIKDTRKGVYLDNARFINL